MQNHISCKNANFIKTFTYKRIRRYFLAQRVDQELQIF